MKTSDVSRMSIRQKVGSVLNRNPTSLEAEREQAIQNFFITLQKVSKILSVARWHNFETLRRFPFGRCKISPHRSAGSFNSSLEI